MPAGGISFEGNSACCALAAVKKINNINIAINLI